MYTKQNTGLGWSAKDCLALGCKHQKSLVFQILPFSSIHNTWLSPVISIHYFFFLSILSFRRTAHKADDGKMLLFVPTTISSFVLQVLVFSVQVHLKQCHDVSLHGYVNSTHLERQKTKGGCQEVIIDPQQPSGQDVDVDAKLTACLRRRSCSFCRAISLSRVTGERMSAGWECMGDRGACSPPSTLEQCSGASAQRLACWTGCALVSARQGTGEL